MKGHNLKHASNDKSLWPKKTLILDKVMIFENSVGNKAEPF